MRNKSPEDRDVDADDACADDRSMSFQTASQLDESRFLRLENKLIVNWLSLLP